MRQSNPAGMSLVSRAPVQVDGIKSSDVTALYSNVTLGPDAVNFGPRISGTGVAVTNVSPATLDPPYSCPASLFSPVAGELIPGPAQIAVGQSVTVGVQMSATKALSYSSWRASLKTNPNAPLALPAPTGSVTIMGGAAAVGTGQLTGNPVVTSAAANLGAGAHTLTAVYSRDANYAPIAFGSDTVTVGAAATPVIAPGGIVNAASYAGAGLARGHGSASMARASDPLSPRRRRATRRRRRWALAACRSSRAGAGTMRGWSSRPTGRSTRSCPRMCRRGRRR